MDEFLSCDWGTSTLRVRLVKTATLEIEGEVRSDDGAAVSYTHLTLPTTPYV